MKSKRKGAKGKGSAVSGEIQLQFTLADLSNQSATPQDILRKFKAIIAGTPEEEDEGDDDTALAEYAPRDSDDEDEDEDNDPDTSDETDDTSKPEVVEKRKRKLRLARLKKKSKARAYQFSGSGDVTGIAFLEIVKITDLPPERNGTSWLFIPCTLALS